MKHHACFFLQDSITEVCSSFVDLHDRVLNSTDKNLGPVKEIKLIDLSTMNNLLTPADLWSSNKHQAEGVGEANLNAGVMTIMGKLKN
jgi:hypothetical protein